MADQSNSLRAEIVRRWKAELYSADTVVAAVSVAVALPTAFLVAIVTDQPHLLVPLLTTAGIGPSLAHENGQHERQSYRAAATWGLVAAILFTVAFLTIALSGSALGLDTSTASVGALVVTLGAGVLVGRKA
ncbi:hypothetical protein [Halorussus halophilus]|uniref:hypothetical protein n=1 Tax=Halorussus halophilus TaxID=2650975 RepID=UPI001300E856|nr:hypothetical protein [Halorussus halophilus]